MTPRHHLLLLLLCLNTHLTGCHTARPLTDARANAELQAPPVGLDSGTVVVQPPRTLVQKLTGQPAAPAYRLPASAPVRIGKKSQVTIQYGTGNTSTQSSTGKKAISATGAGAKVAVAGKNSTQATDSAQALNTGGGAAATGAGAHAEGGATVQQAKDWRAELATPVGQLVAGVAGAILLGTAVYGFVLWRKKKRVESIMS